LLSPAFVGICLAGFVATFKMLDRNGISWESDWQKWLMLIEIGLVATPLSVPVIFAAYALGRRTMNARIVLAFAIAEAGAVGCLKLIADWFMASADV
jgi:ABC-type nickel/cobalt efflux system permease component RcnA